MPLCSGAPDAFLGLPWNALNLALVTTMLAEQTDLEPGEIVWYGMDVHLYLNHIRQAEEQLSREPRPFPTLRIKRRPKSLFHYRIEDFGLEQLRSAPSHCGPNSCLIVQAANGQSDDYHGCADGTRGCICDDLCGLYDSGALPLYRGRIALLVQYPG